MSLALHEHLSLVRERVAAAGHVLVGLDYDGTLTPIVDDPAQATLSPEMRAAVNTLAQHANTTVAIISGRSLKDVRAMVGMDDLIYAGNHGLEICGPGMHFLEPSAAKMRRAVGWLAAALAKGLAHIPGVIVENKSLTISVHWRKVAPSDVRVVFRHVLAAAGVAPDSFSVAVGNQIFDVRPQVDWHKGAAMSWIAAQRAQPDTLSIYLGDDTTDEDAFRALSDAVTIRVGASGDSCAHYHVASTDSVREFLRWLAADKKA